MLSVLTDLLCPQGHFQQDPSPYFVVEQKQSSILFEQEGHRLLSAESSYPVDVDSSSLGLRISQSLKVCDRKDVFFEYNISALTQSCPLHAHLMTIPNQQSQTKSSMKVLALPQYSHYTAAVLRQYCHSTVAVLPLYCHHTAAILLQICSRSAVETLMYDQCRINFKPNLRTAVLGKMFQKFWHCGDL